MSEAAASDKIQPNPEDLLAGIVAIKQQHAEYGIKKVHSELLIRFPNWTLSENRVKKFMQDNGLSASVPSASVGHLPHAEDCLSRDRAAVLADSQTQIDAITRGIADIRVKELNPKGAGRTSGKTFEFWSTQPMMSLEQKIQDASAEACGPIEPLDKVIEKDPLPLPPGLQWSTFDILNADDLTEVYNLLYGNYVEDDDATFRFDYSREFLMWALTSPGWIRDYHLCIKRDGRMVCIITAVPAIVQVWRQPMRTVEINFLCIHKDLRSQRMSPLLIKEITRRVNLRGTFQAIYTAGVLLPKPISVCRYHHRLINLKKLEEIGFARQPEKLTFSSWQKLNRIPETPLLGMRPMVAADVPAVTLLLTQYVFAPSLPQLFVTLSHVGTSRDYLPQIFGALWYFSGVRRGRSKALDPASTRHHFVLCAGAEQEDNRFRVILSLELNHPRPRQAQNPQRLLHVLSCRNYRCPSLFSIVFTAI